MRPFMLSILNQDKKRTRETARIGASRKEPTVENLTKRMRASFFLTICFRLFGLWFGLILRKQKAGRLFRAVFFFPQTFFQLQKQAAVPGDRLTACSPAVLQLRKRAPSARAHGRGGKRLGPAGAASSSMP